MAGSHRIGGAHLRGDELQMGIFKWRGRISKQEFRKQLVEAAAA